MSTRHNAQSGAYFEQAVEALRSAGDPHLLWGEPLDWHKGTVFERPQRATDALQRRLWLLRDAGLFAALSAEAYANEVLSELLVPSDAAAIDRLPTMEKLLLGPKLAGKEPALDRGTKSLQTIRALFKVRDALVHPRPGSPTARFQYITDDDEKLIGPRVTGIYIVAVAGVMAVLDPLRPPAGPLPARRSDQQVPGCPRFASPGDWRDDRCTASGGSPTTGGAHNTGVASSGKRPQPLGSCSAAQPEDRSDWCSDVFQRDGFPVT